MELGIGGICLRLLCAMAVGMIIGTEREYTNRPAGLRTHILVALGACVVTITGQMIYIQYHALGSSPDPARLSAQVITGVGFLGAGTIMKEGVSVKGLTTAASVWAVACLGIACGYGYYALALAGMVFTLITLTIFESLQRKLINNHSAEDLYTLRCGDVLFCGDTLFAGSCGRTDFPGGSMQKILKSLKRLAQLEGNLQVLPGHMDFSTLGQEKRLNPYLRG